MTKNSEQQRAKDFSEESDNLENRAKATIDDFLRELLLIQDSADEFLLQALVFEFLREFEIVVMVGSRSLATFALNQIPELARAQPVLTLTEQRLLIASVRTDLLRRLETLRLQGEQTGLSVNKAAPTQMLSARKVMEIRMALDAVTVRTAQKAVFDSGKGLGKDKKAVAVIDKVTTDLCLTRMNGQVREWEELFIDPQTGAQWMYPPFIGSTLPKSEIFHFCRTMIIPV